MSEPGRHREMCSADAPPGEKHTHGKGKTHAPQPSQDGKLQKQQQREMCVHTNSADTTSRREKHTAPANAQKREKQIQGTSTSATTQPGGAEDERHQPALQVSGLRDLGLGFGFGDEQGQTGGGGHCQQRPELSWICANAWCRRCRAGGGIAGS